MATHSIRQDEIKRPSTISFFFQQNQHTHQKQLRSFILYGEDIVETRKQHSKNNFSTAFGCCGCWSRQWRVGIGRSVGGSSASEPQQIAETAVAAQRPSLRAPLAQPHHVRQIIPLQEPCVRLHSGTRRFASPHFVHLGQRTAG